MATEGAWGSGKQHWIGENKGQGRSSARPRAKEGKTGGNLRGPARKHRRRRRRLVVILAPVSLFGVTYSLPPEQETVRAVIQPSTHSESPSRTSAAGAEGSAARSTEDLLGKEAQA